VASSYTVSGYRSEVFVQGRSKELGQTWKLCICSEKGESELKSNPRKLTVICSTSEEAEAEYGKDKIKTYKTSFTNMYHALTHRKTSTMMKLVCLLPEEKVTTF